MPSLEEQTGPDTIAGNAGASCLANTKMGIDAQNTPANNPTQPATDAPPSSQELVDSEMDAGQGAVEEGGHKENKEADPADLGAAAPPANSTQPNVYGGNFGNSVQPVYHDDNRASNQRADANRGELGQQEYNQGATHGGYGNQYRETNPAAEHPRAEATEEKYYGEGAAQPGPQGHAVRDTPASQARAAGQPTAVPTDGRGNTHDTRNLPDKTGPDAAFQNDNGAPTVGSAYASDYGHTSGVGLPAGTPDRHLPLGPNGHGEVEDQRSSRGGYDNQGSQGGRSHDQQPGGAPAAGQGAAPAPVNSPDAPQAEGYGYGHERSEQEKPGNPNTGNSRSGFEPGGSQEGNASQGHGSRGGSYDDENPGARGPEYDQFTQQDKAQNYGQSQREGFRPEGGDQPADADDTAPRRNAGRDEPGQ